VPVWQRIYEDLQAELGDSNFVIISAAQDTGGEAVVGPIFDAANTTYIQIIDVDHTISTVFNFLNVPSAAWVDESGKIVRIDEGTYAKIHPFGGNDVYAPALIDWVRNGENSEYVQSAATVTKNIRVLSTDELKAEAAFRLGNFFRSQGYTEKAEAYWEQARTLNPDSVNYIRQNLTLSEEGSAGEAFRGLMTSYVEGGKHYYRPLDLTEK
jgi:tetratricopeptide (TPR) repeat protein